jgi:protocatechuate 3,4-dioxygenase, alpha subunit
VPLGATPSQTVGPFFGYALLGPIGSELVAPGTSGAIRIEGVVTDGNGEVVPDAMVELWQADAADGHGGPRDPRPDRSEPDGAGFGGFGRCGTEDGGFSFVTVKPARVPSPGGALQAPHIDVSVFARGLLKHLVTRIYFPDEDEANAADPLLSALAADERATLVAVPDGDVLRFDIRLQGEGQTVFLAV